MRHRIPLSDFSLRVIRLIRRIPKGKIATYGQIAELAGKPHAARGVAWILHSCSLTHDLPWQRVLNSKGKIAFSPRSSHFNEQKKRLVDEGVRFLDRSSVDLTRHLWKTRRKRKNSSRRPTPKIFS